MAKTIVFDFDGVIHSYTSGWKGEDIVADPPVDGIREVMKRLIQNGYEVVIVSTRSSTESGRNAMIKWLSEYGVEYTIISDVKPPALVYVDDRALCFDPKNVSTLYDDIVGFKTWMQK